MEFVRDCSESQIIVSYFSLGGVDTIYALILCLTYMIQMILSCGNSRIDTPFRML